MHLKKGNSCNVATSGQMVEKNGIQVVIRESLKGLQNCRVNKPHFLDLVSRVTLSQKRPNCDVSTLHLENGVNSSS